MPLPRDIWAFRRDRGLVVALTYGSDCVMIGR
jgi:hypothetical protein